MKCPFDSTYLCERLDYDPVQVQAHLMALHTDKEMLAWVMVQMLIKDEMKRLTMEADIATLKEMAEDHKPANDFCYICGRHIAANELIERTDKGMRHASCAEK